jgi:hypothetical protein
VWAGYRSGCVRVWSIGNAGPATDALHAADGAVTALALDPDTGRCWVGTSEGVVAVLRCVARVRLGCARDNAPSTLQPH